MTDVLYDPSLAITAELLEDIERVRIGNGHRIRILTTTEPDSDGETRGFGLPDDHPGVTLQRDLDDALAKVEHQVVLALNRQMRHHPLGPWQKQQKGVGEKQLARLLAVIGDPYWNSAAERPRTVSELWAYCGLVPGQKRRKGQKSNWSTRAKTRAWLIAASAIKQDGWLREVYDKRRHFTAERAHDADCPPCHAKAGDPWRPGHQHADAMRLMSKELLRELWRESKRLHEERAA